MVVISVKILTVQVSLQTTLPLSQVLHVVVQILPLPVKIKVLETLFVLTTQSVVLEPRTKTVLLLIPGFSVRAFQTPQIQQIACLLHHQYPQIIQTHLLATVLAVISKEAVEQALVLLVLPT